MYGDTYVIYIGSNCTRNNSWVINLKHTYACGKSSSRDLPALSTLKQAMPAKKVNLMIMRNVFELLNMHSQQANSKSNNVFYYYKPRGLDVFIITLITQNTDCACWLESKRISLCLPIECFVHFLLLDQLQK